MELLFFPLILLAMAYGFFVVVRSTFWGGRNVNQKNSSSMFGNFISPLKFLMGMSGVGEFTKKQKNGAKFLSENDLKKLFPSSNNGLLLDGHQNRLSAEASFTHSMIVAPTGAGKTTRYVIPNILSLDNCSTVITDPSGEIFNKTAGALQRKGFKVQVLAPADPSRSMGYNPLANVSSFAQIREMADTLVRSANKGGKQPSDPFWQDSAIDLISMMIRALSCVEDPNGRYVNFGNVLHLLQNWGNEGHGLKAFIEKHADDEVYRQFMGFISGNEKANQGIISTCNTALAPFNDLGISTLTSNHHLDFQNLRNEKTALFLILPSNKLEFYSFLMNMLYTDLFDFLMKDVPFDVRRSGRKCLPVYCMLDEFGHTAIPNFATTCSVIRKYEVSLSVILQNFSQLNTNYGDTEARTIIDGGFQSKLFYPGLPHGTAKEVEASLGKEVVREVKLSGDTNTKEQSLLNADRIRTLHEDTALLLTGNLEPMMLKTVPSYKNKEFLRMMKTPYRKPRNIYNLKDFQRVPLT